MNLKRILNSYEIKKNNSTFNIAVGEDIFKRGICLPSDIKMTEDDLNKIVAIIKRFV